MSLPHRSRRLVGTALTYRPQPSCTCALSITHLQTRHSSFFDRIFGRNSKTQKSLTPAILDPSSPDFLRRRPPPPPEAPKRGELAPGSILEEDDAPLPSTLDTTSRTTSTSGQKRDPNVMAAALDPLPQSRMRWQRKMVIRDIRKRGRLSKTERMMRTERESVSKSDFFKTSVKKLYPLARQITGKPLAEAIVQMRFSKKKVALDVKSHLEYARDEAVVRRGMGLGLVKVKEEGEGEGEESGDVVSNGGEEKSGAWPRIVQDKKGKKRVVADPTAMYVDQAWVGRGTYTLSPSCRARGKTDILRHPKTSITVVLKEEATRIRLQDEREQKRKNQRVWVPLPDRPITAQRQYPLW